MDLNLLVVFDALMREHNVSRAARDLGLTQSATSNALARLRIQLDDPVLVRRGRRMEPTPLARALAPEVEQSLARIQRVLSTSVEFDPSTAQRRFTLGLSDYVALIVLPALLERLRQRAPGLELSVVPFTPDMSGRLREGKLDLVIAPTRVLGGGMRSEVLFEDRSVTLIAADQLPPGGTLTLEEFVAREHVFIAPFGGERSAVDIALAERGLSRRIAVRFPHFLLAPHLVARSSMIATLAHRVAVLVAQSLPLRVVEPPLRLPGFSISQAWEPTFGEDLGVQWLRSEVREVCRQLPGPAAAGVKDAKPRRARSTAKARRAR